MRATKLLFISQARMSDYIARYPVVAENYIRFLSDRIRFLNRKIANFTNGRTETACTAICLSTASRTVW